jgi:hypothetical protein
MTDNTADRDAQIAAAESKGDFALAGKLKAEQLVAIRDRPRAPVDPKVIADLRQRANEAEALGNWGESARLRAEWARALAP